MIQVNPTGRHQASFLPPSLIRLIRKKWNSEKNVHHLARVRVQTQRDKEIPFVRHSPQLKHDFSRFQWVHSIGHHPLTRDSRGQTIRGISHAGFRDVAAGNVDRYGGGRRGDIRVLDRTGPIHKRIFLHRCVFLRLLGMQRNNDGKVKGRRCGMLEERHIVREGRSGVVGRRWAVAVEGHWDSMQWVGGIWVVRRGIWVGGRGIWWCMVVGVRWGIHVELRGRHGGQIC